jgi:hypothetical protein
MLVALVVVCFAVLVMAWRVCSRAGSVGDPHRPGRARLEKELARLDPWSFHALPGRDFGADHVVVGTTGAFAIKVAPAPRVGTVAATRRAAKRLRRRLGAAAYHGGVHALLCIDGSVLPRTTRGVRVVPRSLLVKEVAERERTAQPHQVRRVAETLTRRAVR